MLSRRFLFPLFAAFACLAADVNWQAVTNLPGVDWKNLPAAKRQAGMRLLQAEGCTCGCDMKIAECRVKDPSCGVSRKLAGTVAKDFSEGKDAAGAKAHLEKVLHEPAPLLDDAVNISTTGDPVRGPAGGRITIVEFSDFQCPYCSKVVAQVHQVLKQFPQVRFVFKQFPLDSHSDAEFGAEASLAAQAQGKFWEMHDLLYAGFPDLKRERVFAYARELKLDIPRFTQELDSHKYRARVLAEEKEGEDAGVSGTPTFFFNGRKLNGNFDVQTVAGIIRKDLK